MSRFFTMTKRASESEYGIYHAQDCERALVQFSALITAFIFTMDIKDSTSVAKVKKLVLALYKPPSLGMKGRMHLKSSQF